METCSVLFFSSSEISIPLLEVLNADGRFEVVGLVCQPDKPVGRGQIVKKVATKEIAERCGIPVYQDKKFEGEVDFLLTFAYGKILGNDWLGLAGIEALNVHASLLPKYRGASPIQAAILNGDKETGISLMRMVKEMDAGPVFSSRVIELPEEMTAGILHDELANVAAEFVPDELLKIKNGEIEAVEQKGEVSHCKKISREDGKVDFKKSAGEILRMFRAYSPWPGLWTMYKGKRLKLVDIEVSGEILVPGEVKFEDHSLLIGTSDGSIKVKQLQLEGKQCLHADQFVLGQPDFCDASL